MTRHRPAVESLRPPEQERLRAAVADIKRQGVKVETTGCCWGCSWNLAREHGVTDADTVAIYTTQVYDNAFGERRERDGRMKHPLYIAHQGDSKLICEALSNAGLRIEWNGDPERSIKVLPDLRNDGEPT